MFAEECQSYVCKYIELKNRVSSANKGITSILSNLSFMDLGYYLIEDETSAKNCRQLLKLVAECTKLNWSKTMGMYPKR